MPRVKPPFVGPLPCQPWADRLTNSEPSVYKLCPVNGMYDTRERDMRGTTNLLSNGGPLINV